MFYMQLSYDKAILGTGEKVEKNPCFSQALNCCQWYHEQHCKLRALVPLALPKITLGMAQPGAAPGSEHLWLLLQRLRDHELQTTLSGETRGKKEIPILTEQGQRRLEKYCLSERS